MSAIVSIIPPGRPKRRLVLPLLAATGVALLSGCGALRTDHVTVGAVPDDYRTNHPIVVGEKQESIDVPVAVDGYRLTRGQRDVVEGFLYPYDRKAASPVTILVPDGAANSAAASSVVVELGRAMRRQGVTNVFVQSYQVGQPDVSAPLRVTYTAIRASTGKCGRWPEDLNDNPENRHWANFGCSYQNNLAAQIADPHDLLGPRRSTEIDAENRTVAIDTYQKQKTVFESTINYDQ
ncbi:MAG: CpaD family pilus assembly lipoprotein [Mesorhizobium sp.]|nr:CpaD family pilus assembly lipoprotein [Mesorhizobium sp.]